MNYLQQAMMSALRTDGFSNVPNKRYARVLQFACELSKLKDKGDIFLPANAVSMYLGMDAREVSVHIKKAAKEGYLKKISEPMPEQRICAIYRFQHEQMENQ